MDRPPIAVPAQSLDDLLAVVDKLLGQVRRPILEGDVVICCTPADIDALRSSAAEIRCHSEQLV